MLEVAYLIGVQHRPVRRLHDRPRCGVSDLIVGVVRRKLRRLRDGANQMLLRIERLRLEDVDLRRPSADFDVRSGVLVRVRRAGTSAANSGVSEFPASPLERPICCLTKPAVPAGTKAARHR